MTTEIEAMSLSLLRWINSDIFDTYWQFRTVQIKVMILQTHARLIALWLVELELVSKELNHLAAILHVYAGGLNFMK